MRELVLDGDIDRDMDTALKLVFAAVFAIAATTRKPRYHEVLVSVNIALLAVYIGVLFNHMPGR